MFESKDHYTLTIPKDIEAIKERLQLNTLYRNKKLLGREITSKLLIGKVDDSGFLLITSSKIGFLCVLNGTFETANGMETVIEIETRLNKVFIVLFTVWAILMGAGAIVGSILTAQTFSIGPFFMLLLAACLFRFVLYKAYGFTRNRSIRKIENLLY